MVIKGLFQCSPVKNVHDEWYSKKSAWQDLQDYIPRDNKIWEAFMLDGLSPSAQYLTELGFNVDWDSNYFFEEEKREDTVIVSDIPFSLKKKVLIDQPWL